MGWSLMDGFTALDRRLNRAVCPFYQVRTGKQPSPNSCLLEPALGHLDCRAGQNGLQVFRRYWIYYLVLAAQEKKMHPENVMEWRAHVFIHKQVQVET